MLMHGHRAGGRFSPTYNSWRAMVQRCTNERHPFFADYGGRGIRVCERWRGQGGFERFLADVGERPAGLTLDRVDCEGDYEPGNVRWATKYQQRWNRRDMAARLADASWLALEGAGFMTDVAEPAGSMPF